MHMASRGGAWPVEQRFTLGDSPDLAVHDWHVDTALLTEQGHARIRAAVEDRAPLSTVTVRLLCRRCNRKLATLAPYSIGAGTQLWVRDDSFQRLLNRHRPDEELAMIRARYICHKRCGRGTGTGRPAEYLVNVNRLVEAWARAVNVGRATIILGDEL